MKLYLLRHAEAHYSSPDASRKLTALGQQTIVDLAQLAENRIKLEIDEVWHSPFTRARETAELFKAEAILKAPLIATEGLTPMDSTDAILERLEASSKNLLLVGHNPHLESLSAQLLGLDPFDIPINVPKAAFLHFRRTGKRWQLRDHLTTKFSSER